MQRSRVGIQGVITLRQFTGHLCMIIIVNIYSVSFKSSTKSNSVKRFVCQKFNHMLKHFVHEILLLNKLYYNSMFFNKLGHIIMSYFT